MDVKDRLEQVSTHLRVIDIFPYLRDKFDPFNFSIYKNAFDDTMWHANATYHSPIGKIYVQVIVELSARWSIILVYNEERCVYKYDIDIP